MSFEINNDELLEIRNARKRNIKINIAKTMIANPIKKNNKFTREDLKNIFNMKESDIIYIIDDLFNKNDGFYYLKNEFSNFLNKVFASNSVSYEFLALAEAQFLKIYGRFRKEFEKDYWESNIFDSYESMYISLKDIIPIIHWSKLPLFNNNLIINRNIIPEYNLLDFYNHIDCLNALMEEILNRGVIFSNKGDLTLDKEMPFEVYTRRFNHKDRYYIKRTVDGWNCRHISINGKCRRNGEGAFFENLNHDSIFYPKEGIEYAMSKLWNEADNGKIDFEELKKRLQQIADWISNVEKAVGTQPNWVNYY